MVGVLIDIEALDTAARQSHLSGVITVDVAEERVLVRCHGYRQRALAAPATVDTRFALASGSKIFTALAVLRLIETGRLAVTDRVRPLLGDDLPLVDDRVTVEHLFGHTPASATTSTRTPTGTPPTTCSRCRCTPWPQPRRSYPWWTGTHRPSLRASGSPTTTVATSCWPTPPRGAWGVAGEPLALFD